MKQIFFRGKRALLFKPSSSPAPGPTGHADTIFTFQDGTTKPEPIIGTLDQQWLIDNGYYHPFDPDTEDPPYWIKTITQVDVGNTVTSIDDETFGYCESITNVTFQENLINIGSRAFVNCFALTGELIIPSTVTDIGTGAFNNCRITSVTIGQGVQHIWEMAFSGCTSLTGALTIPNNITEIGWSAFSGCSRLQNITIPDSVEYIWEEAFSGCSGLESVTIVANGGNAETVQQKMIDAGVDPNITWIGID